MPSFEINPNAKKGSERDKKLQNRADAGGVEGRTAAKMLQKKGKGPSLPGRTKDMKKMSEEEVVPGIKLVDIILGEEKCGKGMYYCYTDKKCKKVPEGLKMTARFGGGGHEPQEVGIDKPVEGGEGGNGGNGGGTSESLSIEDAFGNKFMEVVDLIKPEDITEKCWKGYKKKGMKTMFGKRYPNCVKANEENVNEAPYQVMGSPDGKKEKKIGKPVKSKKYADARAAELADTHKATGGKYRSEYTEEANVEVSEGDKYDNVGKQAARMSLLNNPGPRSTPEQTAEKKARLEKKRGMKLDDHPQFKKEEVDKRRAPSELVARLSAKREGHMAQDGPNKAAYDAKQRVLAKTKAKRMKEEVEVAEAVRLQAEYGNLLAVVVIWRGKSLMIKMFFPQATMPKREDVQREVEKVYPGCKVTQFRRTELQSEYSPHNDPILRVQKEEAECARTPKGKDCAVHGQKCCPSLSEEEVDEAAGEKDACYHKVKARYSVWPSAYASGALVKCRKKGAKNWGNKTKKESFGLSDWRSDLDEDRLGKGAKNNRLGEKLNLKKADMGEVIDDFYDSDAPQFKGKSKEKRRQMAIAAKLQADEERACWKTHKKVGMKMKGGKLVNDCRPKNEEVEVDENRFASHGGKDSDAGSAYAKPSKGGNKKGVYTLKGKDGKPLFDKNEAIDLKKKSSERKLNTNPGEKPESAKEYRKNSEPLRKHREKFGDLAKEDWQSVNRKDKTDGLSQKAVNAYRKENPGSKLKTAVTKKPSELKKGSKDAKRRSSFCSRMKGMKKRLTSAKTARDPDSKINKALRRWNCN